MKQAKKPKRAATVVLVGEWQQTPDGRFVSYYTDEHGHQRVDWAEPETPRSVDDPSYVHTGAENELSGEGNYTHAGGQDALVNYTGYVPGAAEGYTEEPAEEDLVTGLGSLSVNDDEEEEEAEEEEEEEEEDEESVQPSRQPHVATGSSSKGKSSDRRGSKREEKKSSSSKPKKDTQGSTDKKGKGKGKEKETRHHHEPPGRSHASEQPQQHRAPREKRGHVHAHRHQAAPTGGTGGAIQGDTQPVDAGYGARSAPTMEAEAPYYHAGEQWMGGFHGGQQAPQDQIEAFGESSDIGMPSDAGYEPDNNDEDYQRVLAQSRQDVLPAEAYPPGYGQGEPSNAQQMFYGPAEEEDDDDGTVTPTKDNPGLDISGTPGNVEPLDERYRVEPSSRFQPGEVFKILWAEPEGQPRDTLPNRLGIDTFTEKVALKTKWGERFYANFRRFIVVAVDEGHCTCVPIHTYMHQGCRKRGVKPAKHGIVHQFGTKPRLLDGEPPLDFHPIRMHIQAAGERLARESRVNYSKLLTVEHNVKVFFIGYIEPQDFNETVRAAVDKCWWDKSRTRGKKGSGKDSRR